MNRLADEWEYRFKKVFGFMRSKNSADPTGSIKVERER